MNPDNLTPWTRGQSGNPGGRPTKRSPLDEALAERLAANDASKAQTIADKLLERAETGDPRTIKLITDRIESHSSRLHQSSNPTPKNVEELIAKLETALTRLKRFAGVTTHRKRKSTSRKPKPPAPRP